MGLARCTLQVRGLDCPKEVDALHAALRDVPGIKGLAFDLVHATMTVDYLEELVDSARLIGLIGERAGLQATRQGDVERTAESWWSRHERWILTASSGMALAAGVAVWWLGPRAGLPAAAAERIAWLAYVLAIIAGGIGLFPKAARNLRQLRFDVDVLMGLAILGAMVLGQWDEAATVAFLYGLSESLEALSLERARRSIRALLDLTPPVAERVGPDGSVTTVDAGEVRPDDRILV
jgi:Zn2+/Cd2+-exporting ATPase